MKRYFKTLLLLLLPALVFANDMGKFKGKYTKEKTVQKEYTVNSDAELYVSNSYGNIDISTWNENRTVIEVHIKTNANSEEKAQSKLDDIQIEFTGSASKVSAKTRFNERKTNWNWWGGSKNNNVRMEINYTIKIPVTNSVDLHNDYGAITINRLEGRANISCDYGQLYLGDLLGENNYLSFDYTKTASISSMASGKINADYSNYTLDKVGALELNADYTKSDIKEVNVLDYSCDYGRLTIGTVKNIDGGGDYVPVRINTLRGRMDITAEHGSVSVDRITEEGGDVDIRSEYAGIKIGFDSGYHFDFDLRLEYAGFSGEDEVTVMRTAKDNSYKAYSGYHGKKGSGNTINIDSEYGRVSFNKY